MCLAAQTAPATAAKPAGTYSACMAKANSTRDMQNCQTAGLAEAESGLGAAYTQAIAALPTDQQAQLRAAQRRWIAFRRADCRVFYGRQTGTIATIEGGRCMIDRTHDRINELRDFRTK